MQFPEYRARRLRRTPAMRRLLREVRLSVDQLVLALRVRGQREPTPHAVPTTLVTVDEAVRQAGEAWAQGVRAVLISDASDEKRRDAVGSTAWSDDGPTHRALKAIRAANSEIALFAEASFAAHTDHGRDGVIIEGQLDNDATVENLGRTALSLARAGADVIAVTTMMDGEVGFIRETLDEEGFEQVGILAGSAGHASVFAGPTVDGDEHRLDPSAAHEAVREAMLDEGEGADLIMVQPALPCLDVIARLRDQIELPLVARMMPGELAMITAAAERGWLDRDRAIGEVLTALRRAGADVIVTPIAAEAARLLGRS